jgi:hypothetical protein
MNTRKYNSGETKRIQNQEKYEEIKRQKDELRKFLYSRPSGKEEQVCASTCLPDSEICNSNVGILVQKADVEHNEQFQHFLYSRWV